MLAIAIVAVVGSLTGLGLMARSVRVTARTARHAAGLF